MKGDVAMVGDILIVEHPDPESGNVWTEIECSSEVRDVLLMIIGCKPHGENAVWFDGSKFDFERFLVDMANKISAIASIVVF